VARLDPTSRAISAYHFGWTDAEGHPIEGDGGKAVRPRLALLSAHAAGARAEIGMPGAVAVELVHNFSLLHDDLMDGDVERRHRPTVWTVFGAPGAILAGDALLVLAQEVLVDVGTPEALAAARMLSRATRELIRGQFHDLSFETRDDVTLEQCLDMADGKTGALLAASAAIGAQLAGGPDALVGALSAYGRHLGLVFQLVDDLLGIWGDPVTTGKPVLSDLRARKKTLPVTAALGSTGAAGRELAGWLAAEDTHGEEDLDALRRAAELVEAAGGRAWATEEAERSLLRAEQALAGVSIPAEIRDELLALAHQLLHREA
jgi:geranylgeranyl diphosphate synthase type I